MAGLSVENLQELLHHCPLRAYLSYAPPSLFSEELEVATFFSERFIAPDMEECRLLVSHTQNPTNHFRGAPAVFEGQFLYPHILVFDIIQFQRRREDLQGGSFMPSGRI